MSNYSIGHSFAEPSASAGHPPLNSQAPQFHLPPLPQNPASRQFDSIASPTSGDTHSRQYSSHMLHRSQFESTISIPLERLTSYGATENLQGAAETSQHYSTHSMKIEHDITERVAAKYGFTHHQIDIIKNTSGKQLSEYGNEIKKCFTSEMIGTLDQEINHLNSSLASHNIDSNQYGKTDAAEIERAVTERFRANYRDPYGNKLTASQLVRMKDYSGEKLSELGNEIKTAVTREIIAGLDEEINRLNGWLAHHGIDPDVTVNQQSIQHLLNQPSQEIQQQEAPQTSAPSYSGYSLPPIEAYLQQVRFA